MNNHSLATDNKIGIQNDFLNMLTLFLTLPIMYIYFFHARFKIILELIKYIHMYIIFIHDNNFFLSYKYKEILL